MTQAFGYLRVSGKSQLDGDGFPRQRGAIEAYAKANGIEIVRWFEERAVPGKTEWQARPAWSEMMLSLNGIKTIVLERLDRMARELFVQEHIIRDLRRRKIVLISTAEPDLDSTDPTRTMLRQILGAVYEFDRAMIVLKLRGSRERKKADTGRCEGQKPYGHYPGEAETLAEMKRLRSDGQKLDSIALLLDSSGLRSRSGRPWHPHVVGKILRAQ